MKSCGYELSIRLGSRLPITTQLHTKVQTNLIGMAKMIQVFLYQAVHTIFELNLVRTALAGR